MFKTKLRNLDCYLSHVDVQEPFPQIQLLITFDNGYSWVVPFEFLQHIVEPTESVQAFIESVLDKKTPKPMREPRMEFDMIPREDGGFKMKGRNV